MWKGSINCMWPKWQLLIIEWIESRVPEAWDRMMLILRQYEWPMCYHISTNRATWGVGRDGPLHAFLAGVEQKQRQKHLSFLFSPPPYPPPKPQMEPVKFTMILTSPLHSQALPLSLVSSLRINLSVTLLNQVLPGKGPCCRDDRNQTPNGFPGAEGSEGFSCSFSCQRIKERMWVIGLQQCKEEF